MMNEKHYNQQADDFDSAWQEVFARFRPQVVMTTALLNLTGMGKHPVEIERLAEAIGQSPDETVALAGQWAYVHVADGLIHFDPEGSPYSRYRVKVGARVLDTGGCAVDIFWAVLATSASVRAESRCPTTGTPIRVDLSPEGVELISPPGAIVTVLNPRAPVLQEMNNGENADANVCSQQSFFASAGAAANWLNAHPGGRVYPVAAAFEWFRQNVVVTVEEANADVQDRSTKDAQLLCVKQER
jgi:alkylmercury lyase